MIPTFFEPYEDEFYYGWLYRLATANGFTSIKQFFDCFGYGTSESVFRDKKLYYEPEMELIRGLFRDNGCELDELDFIEQHTLFEMDALTQNARGFSLVACDLFYGVNYYQSRRNSLKSMHFCPKCIQEDQVEGREAYYRTWQQFPQSKICAKHKCKLREAVNIDLEKDMLEEIPVYPDSFCDMPYERRISEWLYKLYQDPLGIDKFLLRVVVNNRLFALSNNTTDIAQSISRGFEEYGTSLKGKSYEKRAYTTLKIMTGQDIFCVACFLFPYKTFSDACKKQKEFIFRQFREEGGKNLRIIRQRGAIYEVRCKKCGNIFTMYNQPFAAGFNCPQCYPLTKDIELTNILSYSGSRHFEKIESDYSGALPTYKCMECGDIYDNRVGIASLTPLTTLCSCGNNLTLEDYQTMADPSMQDYVVEAKMEHGIVLRHVGGCSRTFYLSFKQTKMGAACTCERDWDDVQSQYDPDEYEAFFDDTHLILKHKLCGTSAQVNHVKSIKRIEPCHLCYPIPTAKQTKAWLYRYSGEEYRKINSKGSNHFELLFKDGYKLNMDRKEIINELTSPKSSMVFPNHITVNIEQSISSKVFCAVRDYCQQHNGIWNEQNGLALDNEPEELSKILEYLVRHKYLEKHDDEYVICSFHTY